MARPREGYQRGVILMRSLTGVCFAVAFIAAVLALSGAPASAIETQPGAQAAQASKATLVDWRGRCFKWHAFCHHKYPMGGWRYRRCLGFHGCFR